MNISNPFATSLRWYLTDSSNSTCSELNSSPSHTLLPVIFLFWWLALPSPRCWHQKPGCHPSSLLPFLHPQPPSNKSSSSVKRVSEVVYEFIYSLCPYCFHFTLILNYVLNLCVLNYCTITTQRKVRRGQPRAWGPVETVYARNEAQRLKNATGYDLVFLVGNYSTSSSLKATN